MSQERRVGLFCGAHISQTVEEMSHSMIFPEANNLGGSGKSKKLVPLKARMAAPGLQQMAMLWIAVY